MTDGAPHRAVGNRHRRTNGPSALDVAVNNADLDPTDERLRYRPCAPNGTDPSERRPRLAVADEEVCLEPAGQGRPSARRALTAPGAPHSHLTEASRWEGVRLPVPDPGRRSSSKGPSQIARSARHDATVLIRVDDAGNWKTSERSPRWRSSRKPGSHPGYTLAVPLLGQINASGHLELGTEHFALIDGNRSLDETVPRVPDFIANPEKFDTYRTIFFNCGTASRRLLLECRSDRLTTSVGSSTVAAYIRPILLRLLRATLPGVRRLGRCNRRRIEHRARIRQRRPSWYSMIRCTPRSLTTTCIAWLNRVGTLRRRRHRDRRDGSAVGPP